MTLRLAFTWRTIKQDFSTKDCGNSAWLFLVLGAREVAVYMAFSLYLICFDTVYLDLMSDVDNFQVGYRAENGLVGVVQMSW